MAARSAPNASNVQRALPQMTALHPDTRNTSLQTVAPPAPDASLRMLKHGTRLLEPDVYVARVGARQAVFKDYRRYKWTPLAPLARLLVRHEARVLDRLSGWGYAPALLGPVGGLLLGMEFINGRVLGHDVAMVSDEVFRQLRSADATLPAAALAHNDLHPPQTLVTGATGREWGRERVRQDVS